MSEFGESPRSDLAEARRELYSLPLDSFTAARDALASRLRSGGDGSAAAEVRSLRKPSVPAWAVNQLVRRHRDEIGSLVATSSELRVAQTGHGDPQTVRRLAAQRRASAAALGERAAEILEEAGLGRSSGALERVTNTLLALTTDEEGEQRLLTGSLTRDETPTGFAGSLEFVTDEAPPPTARRKSASSRREARRLAQDAKSAEREAGRLEALATRAEEDAARARAEANDARERARRARRAAAEAEGRPPE
jgi:hypothetical protein